MPQLEANVAENTNENLWHNLKNVIRQSSGFQHWQATQARTSEAIASAEEGEDALVISYLRDTLQTLAYWLSQA